MYCVSQKCCEREKTNSYYTYTNQSLKDTNGTFHLKSPNIPDDFFYLSITVERFTVYNQVVLYLWMYRKYKDIEISIGHLSAELRISTRLWKRLYPGVFLSNSNFSRGSDPDLIQSNRAFSVYWLRIRDTLGGNALAIMKIEIKKITK